MKIGREIIFLMIWVLLLSCFARGDELSDSVSTHLRRLRSSLEKNKKDVEVLTKKSETGKIWFKKKSKSKFFNILFEGNDGCSIAAEELTENDFSLQFSNVRYFSFGKISFFKTKAYILVIRDKNGGFKVESDQDVTICKKTGAKQYMIMYAKEFQISP